MANTVLALEGCEIEGYFVALQKGAESRKGYGVIWSIQ